MIEILNAEAIFGESDITIKVPRDHVDAWANLRGYLEKKRITQVYCKIGRPRRIRTTGYRSQNHHLNGHCQQIAEYTGDYFDDVKRHIKMMAIAKGYPSKTNSFGEVVALSEADATTFQCAMLIDAAHEAASFLDIKLKEYEDV